MTHRPVGTPDARSSLILTLALVALTGLHHLYGAWRYATPWRMHGIAIGLVLVLVGVWLLWRGHIGSWLAISTFVAVVVGLIEGGYNHGVKLVFALRGAVPAALFPSPPFEVPSDVVFEASGVAQLLVGIALLGANLHLHRRLASSRYS